MNDLKAVILAAGQGLRLRPHTEEIPKCLLKVAGTPILGHQLKALLAHGITDAVLIVGYKADEIQKYVSEEFPSINAVFVHNPLFASTNTLYSLALAVPHIRENEPVIQLNGDVVMDPAIIGKLCATDGNMSFSAVTYRPCGNEEVKAVLADDNSILYLNKKIQPESAVGEAIGINKFSCDFWREMSRHLKTMQNDFAGEYFELAIESSIAGGKKLMPCDLGDMKAIEVDFPEDLKSAEQMFGGRYEA